VTQGAVVIVGGTSGLGLRLAESYAARECEVVITGRDAERCAGIAVGIAAHVSFCALDLAEPHELVERLADVGPVARLVLAAIERDRNTIEQYDLVRAVRLVTLKLVGYTEVVHALAPRLTPDASILIFGGQALHRPYAGSTTITTVNGGVVGLMRTLAQQLAPVRVNAIHPGVVGDSPEWASKPEPVLEGVRSKTLIGRLVTMDEIADASMFLLENGAVNGVALEADGGWVA
jgi:NAD(P)-dependent dehydrogenase (short-subunit alcohol dehydrogenase family)